MENQLAKLFKSEFDRRIYKENIPRIKKCLQLLTTEQIWYSQNEHTNSIGNLVLHLSGNVTQWIGSGIGGMPDDRRRDQEFFSSEQFEAKDLEKRLDDLKRITDNSMIRLSELKIDEKIMVQGFGETPMSILIHVIEHFSYHTGQIAQMTKLLMNRDLGFYAGIDLNKK